MQSKEWNSNWSWSSVGSPRQNSPHPGTRPVCLSPYKPHLNFERVRVSNFEMKVTPSLLLASFAPRQSWRVSKWTFVSCYNTWQMQSGRVPSFVITWRTWSPWNFPTLAKVKFTGLELQIGKPTLVTQNSPPTLNDSQKFWRRRLWKLFMWQITSSITTRAEIYYKGKIIPS